MEAFTGKGWGMKYILDGRICPYCAEPSIFVDSKVVYGVSRGMIYLCVPCDAYVGVHKGSSRALGRLADKELRRWKVNAHKVFDRIWKSRKMSRMSAYKWLSEKMGIPPELTHIGMMDVDQCMAVVSICKKEIATWC